MAQVIPVVQAPGELLQAQVEVCPIHGPPHQVGQLLLLPVEAVQELQGQEVLQGPQGLEQPEVVAVVALPVQELQGQVLLGQGLQGRQPQAKEFCHRFIKLTQRILDCRRTDF